MSFKMVLVLNSFNLIYLTYICHLIVVLIEIAFFHFEVNRQIGNLRSIVKIICEYCVEIESPKHLTIHHIFSLNQHWLPHIRMLQTWQKSEWSIYRHRFISFYRSMERDCLMHYNASRCNRSINHPVRGAFNCENVSIASYFMRSRTENVIKKRIKFKYGKRREDS